MYMFFSIKLILCLFRVSFIYMSADTKYFSCLIEHLPREQSVVHSNPTQGSFLSSFLLDKELSCVPVLYMPFPSTALLTFACIKCQPLQIFKKVKSSEIE